MSVYRWEQIIDNVKCLKFQTWSPIYCWINASFSPSMWLPVTYTSFPSVYRLVHFHLSAFLSSIQQSSHLSNHEPVGPSIIYHSKAFLSIGKSFNLSVHKLIYPFVYLFILTMHLFVNPSIHQIVSLFIHPSIDTSFHPSMLGKYFLYQLVKNSVHIF